MAHKVVLVVAHSGFQEKEYNDTKAALEKSGIEVVTASNKSGQAMGHQGAAVEVEKVIGDLQPSQYDGIFLIGGPTALEHLDNPAMHRILNEQFALEKAYGAICISPRILAQAQILKEKKATCWDGDNQTTHVFNTHNVQFQKDEDVVVDGKVVTASGPDVATDFGNAIAKLLTQEAA